MSDLIPVLTVVDGVPTTTSVQVAEHFGKQHKHVLRDIRDLLVELPPEHQPNFGPMSVEVEIGNGAFRRDPAYHLTKDGFTLLAMGFTGAQALKFKLAYIDAFNRMEAALIEQAAAATKVEATPGAPRIPSHQADRIVAASRTFNALLRSAQAAKVPLPTALRRAAEVAQRETGVDMLAELRAEEHVAGMERQQQSRHPRAGAFGLAGIDPAVEQFWRDLEGGQIAVVGVEPMLALQLQRIYEHWCRRQRRVAQSSTRFLFAVHRAGLMRNERKRFVLPDGSIAGPRTFVLPPGPVERPAGVGEMVWLGECAERVEAAIGRLETAAA